MPVPLTNPDFYAHHSPFGAFASFTLGRFGKRGGFGLELAGPAQQDVYIALARAGQPVEALPFFADVRASGGEAYTGGGAPPVSETLAQGWQTLGPEKITREMGWASDTWFSGDLTFRILTPFGPVPDIRTLGDVELRRLLCPALFVEITVDNSNSAETAHAFFGIGGPDQLRPLSDTGAGLLGVARETSWGFTVVPSEGGEAQEVLAWDIQTAVNQAVAGTPVAANRLSNRAGVLLRVAPGEKRTYTLALGFYRGGVVTSGVATSYIYSRLFNDLESVLQYAVQNTAHYAAIARERDRELEAAPINEERRFLLAHATHSYHGSTMLLHDERGVLPRVPFASSTSVHLPVWVVNEGEYRMMNTFDLTVDHAFFEMRYHPWTLRNALDLFVSRYSYRDDLVDATKPDRPTFPGGISFTHDMGVANQFSPSGYSSYELTNEHGCFSYMTQEQLCNWCLCAAIYGLPTVFGKGDALWLATRRTTLLGCLESLLRRDGPEGERDGVMSLDAARCGTGQEITTYDSLDPSLGQSRANLYLAIKTWAAYLALSRCFDLLGEIVQAAEAEEQAARAAATITAQWDEEKERFPAVFDPSSSGYEAHIIPAIEGLAYPFLWHDMDALSPYGPYGELIARLRRHLKAALVPGVCVDATSGGFKLSSTSENTWMSKIFLAQFVAEAALGLPLPDNYDAVHAGWQRDGACRDFAFTDQVRSTDGGDLGSRFYPRGVTSILWLL